MRRLLAATALALVLASPPALAAPAPAQVSPTPPTTAPYDLDDCVSAVPKPGCGAAPDESGDRGGWAQYLVLGVLMAGLAVIGTVVVRSTRRTTAARAAEAQTRSRRSNTTAATASEAATAPTSTA